MISFNLIVAIALFQCCASLPPTAKDDFEFTFTVDRQTFDDEESLQSNESNEQDDYYLEEEISPSEREKILREPFRRLSKWKQGWRDYPLFVIVLGGFRWDMLKGHEKNLTSFAYLRKHGVSIPTVRPVFPSEDFPVWTSLATGQHPEDHGIVGDFMYDLKNERLFNASDRTSTRMAEWWKDTTPFWSTAAKHGKKIAFYNWHDCQLPGASVENPKDCRPYSPIQNMAAPSKNKIAREFDEAFTKLYKNGYHATVVYTDLLRRVSENQGLKSIHMIKALRDIDDVLQAKLMDIKAKKERTGIAINLLVLSDYGMTDTADTTQVVLEDYLNVDMVQYVVYSAGYASIVPFALRHEEILHEMRDMPGVDIYLAKQVQEPPIFGANVIPDKLKYGKGDNTQDILIVAKPSYRLVSKIAQENDRVIHVQRPDDAELKAGSGYNPLPQEIFYPYIDKRTIMTQKIYDTIRDYKLYHQFKFDMNTQAFAMGPDFKSNYVLKNTLETVDFYQLLCFLLQIPPEDHDGTWTNIEPMMEISHAPLFTPQIISLLLPGLIMMY